LQKQFETSPFHAQAPETPIPAIPVLKRLTSTVTTS